MRMRAWQLPEPGKPLVLIESDVTPPPAGEVVVEVAGCGLCHTDVGFYAGDVQPRAGWPLVLGHEISGRVVLAGEGADAWVGKDVVVPAVIPCGECAACRRGRGNTCAKQVMPGNDRDGGFATHATVPALGLAAVTRLPAGHDLADLSVIADAVSTPLQALKRAKVEAGDFVVVVGAGGVGTHAVQIAAAWGAQVVALDVDAARLEALGGREGVHAACVKGMDVRGTRGAVRDVAKQLGAARDGWKIFECSGTVPGQETAFALLGPAATLGVIGFTREPVSVRLSNLMAFDADAFGSWGCLPELYPEAIDLVADGKVALRPFLRRVPLAELPDVLASAHAPTDPRRVVLVPEDN